MIPLIIGGIATGILGLAGRSVTKDVQREAQETLDRAKDIYDCAKSELESQQSDTEYSLQMLGRRKYDAITGVIPGFVAAFSKFKNVRLGESSGIDELSNMNIYDFRTCSHRKNMI